MASPAVHSRGPAFDGGARMAARRMKGTGCGPFARHKRLPCTRTGSAGAVTRYSVSVFFPDQAKFGAVRRRHGLRPRRSGPRRFDAGRRAVRKLRGRTDPSRHKRATTRLIAPAYWKFESSPLQQRGRSWPYDFG